MMLNQGPKPPTPEQFAGAVAQSSGYELAAAQAALAQSRSLKVRTFAERMIADHKHMAQALGDASRAAGLQPPKPYVGSDQARFLSALQSLRGEEFDREYGRQQMLAHVSALTVMRGYAEQGSDPDLRRFAAGSAPMIERHLQDAGELLRSLS